MNFADYTFIQFDAIARDLAKSKSRNSEATQKRICEKHGVDYYKLSDSECQWIINLIKSYID